MSLVKRPVLVIEDDVSLQLLLTDVLESAGYPVLSCSTGDEGLTAALADDPRLVILDLGLPGMDGSLVLQRIRSMSSVPVVVLSGRTSEIDKARELTAGADDFLTKPFGKIELLARINAVLRRSPADPVAHIVENLQDGDVRVDLRSRQAFVDGTEVPLSRTEYGCLTTLLQDPGRAVPYDELLREAWHDVSGIGADRIKFTMMRLRRKLGPTSGDRIEPVRGFGYRWRPVPAER
jgi:DNA-binding response OmpR family regulator